MNINEENLNINADQSNTQSVENSFDTIIDDEVSQPSLVDKIYQGELDYRSLDPSTRKTVLNEAYGRLDEKGKLAWDNKWRDRPFFLGKDRQGNDVPWKTAEEFLETLELPQVKRERENHRLMDELKKRDTEIERLKNLTKINLDRNIENDEYAINAEIERAKIEFDPEALERAINRKNKLQQNKQEVQQYYQQPQQELNPAEVVNQLRPEDSDALLNFRASNSWYGTDFDMSEFAYKEFVTLNKLAPNKPFAEKLNLVKTRTMAAFPSKFPKQPINNFMPTNNNLNNTPLKPSNFNKVEEVYNKLPEHDKRKVSNLIASGKFNSKEAVLKKYGLI